MTPSSSSLSAVARVLRWSLLVALGASAAVSLGVRVMAQTGPTVSAAPTATAAGPAPVVANTSSATPVSGEAMAHTCSACHGTLGRLGDEFFMPLAGMPQRQFVTTMVDFRDGRRPSTLMGHVAQGFSDAEIEAMGRFFAAVLPTAPNGDKP